MSTRQFTAKLSPGSTQIPFFAGFVCTWQRLLSHHPLCIATSTRSTAPFSLETLIAVSDVSPFTTDFTGTTDKSRQPRSP
jgi:hypothetical protein